MTRQPAQLAELTRRLESEADAHADGWPDELFLFVSRITPLVNVDLLIQDDEGRTLLTWRSDRFHGPGWHVPGGVIRFKEQASERVRIVARCELGIAVAFDAAPILVHESIAPHRRDRGHFVSLLYRCRPMGEPDPRRKCSPSAPLADQWAWHARCPENLLPEQAAYAAFMG